MNRNKYYKIQDLKIGVMLFGPYNEVEWVQQCSQKNLTIENHRTTN